MTWFQLFVCHMFSYGTKKKKTGFQSIHGFLLLRRFAEHIRLPRAGNTNIPITRLLV